MGCQTLKQALIAPTDGGHYSPELKSAPLTYAIDALQREIAFRNGKDLGAGIISTEVESFQYAIDVLKNHQNKEITA